MLLNCEKDCDEVLIDKILSVTINFCTDCILSGIIPLQIKNLTNFVNRYLLVEDILVVLLRKS